MITIALFLWSDPSGRRANVYGPADVERVALSIRRNITIPHEVAAITDFAPHEFSSNVRYIPLWDMFRDLGGCYTRLWAFHPSMREIIGDRFAWMDLDTLVTGSLDPVFSRKEDAVFWRSCTVSTLPYNGSLVMMTAGARANLLDAFDPIETPRTTRELGMIGTDQAAMAHILGPDEAVWTARDGVCAFRRDCRKWLAQHARLVFFPGKTKPTQNKAQLQHPWIKDYMYGNGEWPRRKLNDRFIRREVQRGRRALLRARAKEARQAVEAAGLGEGAAAGG